MTSFEHKRYLQAYIVVELVFYYIFHILFILLLCNGLFLVLFSFFLFYTWLQFQEELPEYNKKAVFTPQMSRGHTTMLLNTFGAVPVKSCVYEEKQEGSVFYSLSQNAKVWGCGCNSQPSGLSGSARPLGMKGLRETAPSDPYPAILRKPTRKVRTWVLKGSWCCLLIRDF